MRRAVRVLIDSRAVHACVCLPLLLLVVVVLWSGVCAHTCMLATTTSSSGSGSCRVSGRHGIFHWGEGGGASSTPTSSAADGSGCFSLLLCSAAA